MPKKLRQKKFLSSAYLNHKLIEKDLPAWAELHERNNIAQFIRGTNRTRELHAESHGVQFLFRKERDSVELRNKGRIVRLYVCVDDAMTKSDYMANWSIVQEYVRQLKEVQWGWSEDWSSRFFEMIEAVRVTSRGKMGYGKLAEMINRRIERQLRAKKRNELIEATVLDKRDVWKRYEECLSKGYDQTAEEDDAETLLRYFDFSEDAINEIVSSAENSILKKKPLYFATGKHAYTEPVTATQLRSKLLKLRRHLDK